MAKPINKLSARAVQTLTEPGRHSDGGGLYLNVTLTGAKSWLFMWKVAGRRREMGLGSARDVSLSKARELAVRARQQVIEGRDPLAEREQRTSITFGEAADALIESMASSWRNAKHCAQWKMTLNVYARPLRAKSVSEITTDDVLRVLTPLWRTKPETASRLRGRIERTLDFAKARGMLQSENKARWRGHLDKLLPKPAKLTRGHHRAMPFEDVPEFMARLRTMGGVAPRALELAVLTGGRTSEVLGARWAEFDLPARIWVVPAARMKGGRLHRVPLSDSACAVLQTMTALPVSEYVFPGQKPGRPLSTMALEAVLRRMKIDVTPHGFRSSLRDWAGETTAFPREIAEAALAHVVGDATERAYRRGDALERRRLLMQAWAEHCDGCPETTNIGARADASVPPRDPVPRLSLGE
ncbi:site-specific integrase [Methylobacterium sp. Leaf88]|uniref:tyrosine-type recombinase/integrase n=1 Tax=Methylobacterium sp. Leaf88 TaxID=1736244 RepID=UPI0009E6C6D2|nr:site-specific integrase [Methylobacterium sp. Leaf88]